MATTLYLRTSMSPNQQLYANPNNPSQRTIWDTLSLSTSRGSTANSLVLTSLPGPTTGIELNTVAKVFVSLPLAADATISGTITANLRGMESSMSANATIGLKVYRLRQQDASHGPINSGTVVGTELATSETAYNFSVTPTSTTVYKGERLGVIVYFDDASGSTMGSGYTLYLYYNGPTGGASGDSYVTFNENLTFLDTAPTGTALYPTGSGVQSQPAVRFSSSFTGAYEDPLSEGGIWSACDGLYAMIRTGSGAAQGKSSPGAEHFSYYNAAFSGAGTSEVWGVVASGMTTDKLYVCARLGSLGTSDYTGMAAAIDSTGLYLMKRTGGAWVSIAGITGLSTITAGDRWGLRHDESRYTAMFFDASLAETHIVSAYDSSYSSGYVGIGHDCTATNVGSIADFSHTFMGAYEKGAYELGPSRGVAALTQGFPTKTGPIVDPLHGVLFISRPLQAFTLSGPVYVNIAAKESATTYNVGRIARILKVSNDFQTWSLWGENGPGSELPTTEDATSCWVTGSDMSFADGDRIALHCGVFDAFGGNAGGVMVIAGYAYIYHGAGSPGSSGDTWIQLTQTVSEYVADRAPLPTYSRRVIQAVNRSSVY